MNKYRSVALAAFFTVAVLALLSQLPLIVSVPILMIWPFVSVGELVVDGYARLLVGSGLMLFAGWRIAVLLPVYFGPSELVQYGQYMTEAQLLVVLVLFAVAVGLGYAGARSLQKARASQAQTE